jgi:hypothetical protein
MENAKTNWIPMTNEDWDWVNGKLPPNPNDKPN